MNLAPLTSQLGVSRALPGAHVVRADPQATGEPGRVRAHCELRKKEVVQINSYDSETGKKLEEFYLRRQEIAVRMMETILHPGWQRIAVNAEEVLADRAVKLTGALLARLKKT